MKKMLVGFIMDGKAGGIDKYLLNFLETVHSEEIQIDFLTNEIDADLEKALRTYRSSLFAIPNLRHPISQYRRMRQIIRSGGYDAVYFNISTAIDCIAAIAAGHERVKTRMIHSHSSGNDCESYLKRQVFNGIHNICRLFLYRYATQYYGCSLKAGEWLFPKRIVDSDRFEVIFNAVDRDRFGYDGNARREVREELGLEGKFVIGHAGNFCYQKNHAYLLQVFAEVLRMEPKALLLLAGDGIRFEDTKTQAEKLGIADSVLFLGRRNDVNRLYQAMDVFLLPSNFEGLPIAGIEAQSAGLPCVMSDTITKEAKITEHCAFLSLKRKPEDWAKVIVKLKGERAKAEFLPMAENYDLKVQQQQLKKLVLDS